jgi:hypothetical protein
VAQKQVGRSYVPALLMGSLKAPSWEVEVSITDAFIKSALKEKYNRWNVRGSYTGRI